MERNPPPPLAGIRVLELGSAIAGPFAGRILADLGADVVKVEPPEGDQLRTWGTVAPDGTSWFFKSHNRGKRLLSLDLREPHAQRVVRTLALQCDIVIENFRAGKLAEWGLDETSLHCGHPELIYVSISGYGQDGPYSDRPGYGNVAESMGGLRYLTGFADRPPVRVGVSLGDQIAALYAVVGALAALEARRRDRRGETVDVALVEACYSFTEAGLPEYVHAGIVRERDGNRHLRAAPSSIYPTADGEWIAIGGNGQNIFRRLCAAMGTPQLFDDPRFASNQARLANATELDERITAFTKGRTGADLCGALAAAGVPAGLVMSIADIAADPHFRARGMIAEIPDDEGGTMATPGIVPKFRTHQTRLGRAAGTLDRDARAVYADFGVREERVAAGD